jgi:putative transposase
LPHHVTQRGNHRADVFVDVDDRIVFLRMLKQASLKYSLRHSAYCLMTNHVHFVCIPAEQYSLSKALSETFGVYAVYFNQKYGFNGRLWQGRFFSAVMCSDDFWTVVRYVERNPVRAGMVERAAEYRWSSAMAHCRLEEDPIADPLPQLPAHIRSWSEWLIDEEDPAQVRNIRSHTRTGQALGHKAFLEQLERMLGRRVAPAMRGRPRRRRSEDATHSLPWFGSGKK